MKKNFIKYLPLMAAAIVATSCNNDDETINPSNGRDGVHIVSTSENIGIPFSIKVETGNTLSKVGLTDNGEQVNISFTDEDVNNLTMTIRSNSKTSPLYYGTLTLTDVSGVFTGILDGEQLGQLEDGEELSAEINYIPKPQSTFSIISLEDLVKNSACIYLGTFTFHDNYLHNSAFKDENIPTVCLNSQNAYFEFYFPNAYDKIGYGWSRIENGKEVNPSSFYEREISSDHKLWWVMDRFAIDNLIKLGYYKFMIKYNSDIIYSKPLSEIANGVIYSVTRN